MGNIDKKKNTRVWGTLKKERFSENGLPQVALHCVARKKMSGFYNKDNKRIVGFTFSIPLSRPQALRLLKAFCLVLSNSIV